MKILNKFLLYALLSASIGYAQHQDKESALMDPFDPTNAKILQTATIPEGEPMTAIVEIYTTNDADKFMALAMQPGIYGDKLEKLLESWNKKILTISKFNFTFDCQILGAKTYYIGENITKSNSMPDGTSMSETTPFEFNDGIILRVYQQSIEDIQYAYRIVETIVQPNTENLLTVKQKERGQSVDEPFYGFGIRHFMYWESVNDSNGNLSGGKAFILTVIRNCDTKDMPSQ